MYSFVSQSEAPLCREMTFDCSTTTLDRLKADAKHKKFAAQLKSNAADLTHWLLLAVCSGDKNAWLLVGVA